MNNKIDYTVGPSLFQTLSKKRRNKWVDELTLPRVDKMDLFLIEQWSQQLIITSWYINNKFMIAERVTSTLHSQENRHTLFS